MATYKKWQHTNATINWAVPTQRRRGIGGGTVRLGQAGRRGTIEEPEAGRWRGGGVQEAGRRRGGGRGAELNVIASYKPVKYYECWSEDLLIVSLSKLRAPINYVDYDP